MTDFTPAQLLANMQRIAQKMDADMRTVSAFMKLSKAKYDETDRRLAALEAKLKQSAPGVITENWDTASRAPIRPAEATVTIERQPEVEDAIFTEGEGD